MKKIEAYIKPNMLTKVCTGLHEIEGLTGMSVMEITGCGRGRGEDPKDHIVSGMMSYKPHLKVEVVADDDLAEEVISVIQERAHTGLRGDGKVYIYSVEDAVRIRTGERGEDAV